MGLGSFEFLQLTAMEDHHKKRPCARLLKNGALPVPFSSKTGMNAEEVDAAQVSDTTGVTYRGAAGAKTY